MVFESTLNEDSNWEESCLGIGIASKLKSNKGAEKNNRKIKPGNIKPIISNRNVSNFEKNSFIVFKLIIG